ncbi:uncharacterized protein B0P05DRAFT_534038 [Gilbertella persicaria]|uniref:uncharacterized protein n=1 Tax=Gilbertella persicaria TaxID=101096 RepID=UPI00221EA9BB|nr:uncharacterized protein B0P05DRAFT_534038 [Gilbertella persicaria]KAI8085870.1 hypothetical protein B0P05DRAFT_534038 [Gilbertella persicaria]
MSQQVQMAHRNIITRNPYLFYTTTSFAFGIVVTLLALCTSPNTWSDFYNSRPVRGDMGFGRFLIRGTRFVNGQYTPFAYPWRQVNPSQLGEWIAWTFYLVHQVSQWLILARVQLSKQKQVRWSDDYQWWNWQMVYLNSFMAVYKIIHGHLFYDGLSLTVPEGVAQGSVVVILVFAIIMAIPYRGIIFGYGKKPASDPVIQFIRKYHGYGMSFGTVLNFHYHPVEGTMGHCFGFIYQCLLIWQSTNFLHRSHRNKTWVLFLEIWVFIHGTLTALIQPGIGWQIFSYGFMVMFLVNQVFQTRFSQNRFGLSALYSLFFIWAYYGFRKDKGYYRATFIPVSEYLCVYFALGVGKSVQYGLEYIPKQLHKPVIFVAGLGTTAALTVGLALTLAGNLKVYNDY